jgi:hypothetical protein
MSNEGSTSGKSTAAPLPVAPPTHTSAPKVGAYKADPVISYGSNAGMVPGEGGSVDCSAKFQDSYKSQPTLDAKGVAVKPGDEGKIESFDIDSVSKKPGFDPGDAYKGVSARLEQERIEIAAAESLRSAQQQKELAREMLKNDPSSQTAFDVLKGANDTLKLPTDHL